MQAVVATKGAVQEGKIYSYYTIEYYYGPRGGANMVTWMVDGGAAV